MESYGASTISTASPGMAYPQRSALPRRRKTSPSTKRQQVPADADDSGAQPTESGMGAKFDRYIFPYILDLYSVTPTYQWNRTSSRFSKIMTVATIFIAAGYIVVSLNSFTSTIPELVLRSSFTMSKKADVDVFSVPIIAFSVDFNIFNATTGESETRFLGSSNADRYFTFALEHQTIVEQRKGGKFTVPIPSEHIVNCKDYLGVSSFSDMFCIDPQHLDEYKLQGEWIFEKYQYLNFKLNRCVDQTPTGEPCADPQEVLDIVQSSDSVQIQLFLRNDQYDISQFEKSEGGDPVSQFDRSWRWFAKAGYVYSLQHEVYLRYKTVKENDRYFTASMAPTPVRELLEFGHIDSYDRPMGQNYLEQDEYLEFFIRMNTSAQKAEVVYPSGSIITLITLWGAFLNILTNFSLGLITRTANLYISDDRFKRSTAKLTRTSKWSRGNNKLQEKGQ